MSRALKINCKSKLEFDDKGVEKTTQKTPYEIEVEVDSQKDNGSFTIIPVLGDWYHYEIERLEDASRTHANGYVKILLRVKKNLSTSDRIGIIKIEHNCIKLAEYVEIYQDGVEYSLTSKYVNGWLFKSIPSELYEEKIVELKATNGRGRWCVKEIQQYQVRKGDSFGDLTEEYKGKESQDEQMNQIRVPYDGVFKYRIEGDKLIIRSFGQIDLITKKNDIDGHPHMRYFFVLSHSDVNNSNKDALEEKKIKYNDRKLFIFDGDEGNGCEYGEGDSPSVEPTESDSYVFTVNNSKSPLINVDVKGNNSIKPLVVSTKNGENLSYSVSQSGNEWCTVNTDGTLISVTKNEGGERECTITYTQSETNDVITLKIVQEAAENSWVFTVNNNTKSFIVPQFESNTQTYNITVVSKYGNKDIDYTVTQQNTVSWVKFENNKITLEKNPTTKERQVVYVFTQGGGSDKAPIYVTISQKGVAENWVFTVTPSSKEANSLGETIALTITSTHNDEFVAFKCQENSDSWLYFDSSSNSIVVSPYKCSEEGTSRSCTLTFQQSESDKKQTVTISQKKQAEGSAVLVFKDGGTEKTKLTLTFDETKSHQTFIVKSTTSDNLPDKNITVVGEVEDWITLDDFNVIEVGCYTGGVTCKANTSQDREQSITFKNSSGKTIVLSIVQAGKKIKKNTITFKAGPDVNTENQFELYVVYLTNGKMDIANKVSSFTFKTNTDKKEVQLEEGKVYFLTYNDGKGEGDLTVTQQLRGSTNSLPRIKASEIDRVNINNTDGEVVTINAQNISYVYELEEDTLTVGWEGKYYSEPFAKVYSYSNSGTTQEPIDIEKCVINEGDFIKRVEFTQTPSQDEYGYYYKITIEVSENTLEEIKTGKIIITNKNGKDLTLNVIQRKNGDIILTDFDYIVINYRWTDYIVNKKVYSRDFDSVMYFDTPSIGSPLYHKTAHYGYAPEKTITNEEGKVYAELAYDQISSTLTNYNRIETQVVYLKELCNDGYLQKIKESGDKTLDIQLYGNLYELDDAYSTPYDKRIVDMEFHTYLGGTMERDDSNKTMVNVEGEDRHTEIVPTYHLTSIYHGGGSNVDIAKSFNYLGTIKYSVKGKNAVLELNPSLYVETSNFIGSWKGNIGGGLMYEDVYYVADYSVIRFHAHPTTNLSGSGYVYNYFGESTPLISEIVSMKWEISGNNIIVSFSDSTRDFTINNYTISPNTLTGVLDGNNIEFELTETTSIEVTPGITTR